jgi:hypothetical protein
MLTDVDRSFATATRNYAKRQLQWYRKDKSFLWIRSSQSESVATEIVHWSGRFKEEIVSIIDSQCQQDEAAKLAKQKKLKSSSDAISSASSAHACDGDKDRTLECYSALSKFTEQFSVITHLHLY